MNFIVCITLLMRWPVKSWKLQASKIATTRSWISSLSSFCWSGEMFLDNAVAAWSIASTASENLLGGLFGAADDGAEFAVDLGHFLAVKAGAVQGCDFALGAVDRVVNQVELDLELRALLDLGAIGFQQRLGICGLARDIRGDEPHRRAAWPKPAICARIARSSDMISRCIGPISPPSTAGMTIGASPSMACSIRKRLRLTDMRFSHPFTSGVF